MLAIALRTVLVYFFLVLGMRLMGKRQLGQMQLSELVTALLLSEIAVLPVTDTAVPLSYSLLPAGLVLTLEVMLPALSARFSLASDLLDGRPAMLICRGKLDQKALLSLRMSVEELLSELRLQGVGDLSDVDYAILEPNGRLSIILRQEKQPVTAEDLGIAPVEKAMAHPLVLGGKISDFNLRLTGKDRRWLRERLREKRCRARNALLFTLDDNGGEALLRREDKRK